MAFDEFDALGSADATIEPNRKGLPIMALWRIEIVRAKLELPPISMKAIVKAMAEFNIPEERRKRIIVQKISKAKD
jgi:hypothetical protein